MITIAGPAWTRNHSLKHTLNARRCIYVASSAVFSIACLHQLLFRKPWLGFVPFAVSTVFCVNSLWLREDKRGGKAISTLVGCAAFLWPTNYVFEWQGSFAVHVSMMGSTTFWWVMATAFLRYPHQNLGNVERLYLTVLGLGLGLPEVYSLATGDGYEDIPFFGPFIAALGLTVFLVAIRRFLSYRGLERRVLLPLLIAGVIIGGSGGISWLLLLDYGIYTAHADQAAIDIIYLVQGLILLATPFAFAAIGLRRRFVQAALGDRLARLPAHASLEAVQVALREVLQDDRLDLWSWVPDINSYVDATGHAMKPPTASPERSVTEIRTITGDPLALLLADRELAREAALAGTALSPSTTPLLTAWLQAAHEVRQTERHALARRVEEVRFAQRERIGRDLHDGMQQRLLALGMSISAASRQIGIENSAARTLMATQLELESILTDLRNLVHEIAPAVLRKRGLKSAVQSMAERLEISVCTKNLTEERPPPAVEFLGYNIAAECLANTIKHAQATHTVVSGVLRDGSFVMDISDDGVGGAEVAHGTGILGLRDRVVALGGVLTLDSLPGEGTRLVARIPCE